MHAVVKFHLYVSLTEIRAGMVDDIDNYVAKVVPARIDFAGSYTTVSERMEQRRANRSHSEMLGAGNPRHRDTTLSLLMSWNNGNSVTAWVGKYHSNINSCKFSKQHSPQYSALFRQKNACEKERIWSHLGVGTPPQGPPIKVSMILHQRTLIQ